MWGRSSLGKCKLTQKLESCVSLEILRSPDAPVSPPHLSPTLTLALESGSAHGPIANAPEA